MALGCVDLQLRSHSAEPIIVEPGELAIISGGHGDVISITIKVTDT
jgi:hypothetical protein